MMLWVSLSTSSSSSFSSSVGSVGTMGSTTYSGISGLPSPSGSGGSPGGPLSGVVLPPIVVLLMGCIQFWWLHQRLLLMRVDNSYSDFLPFWPIPGIIPCYLWIYNFTNLRGARRSIQIPRPGPCAHILLINLRLVILRSYCTLYDWSPRILACMSGLRWCTPRSS